MKFLKARWLAYATALVLLSGTWLYSQSLPNPSGSASGGGAVTNAGTFVVQEDGAALTALQLIDNAISGAGFNITGFNGTVPSVITAHADNQSNTRNTQAVAGYNYLFDGSTWDRALGDSTDGALVNLGTNNDVVATAGLLHANSPTTLIDTFVLFDGSAETQIATTNLGASKSITISGTGRLTKICIIVSLGTPFAEDMSIIFFDADPSITIEDASLTLAQAQNAQVVISLTAAGFRDNFATAKLNCQDIDESFSSITHVVFASEGATTYDDEDIEMRLWYRRDS